MTNESTQASADDDVTAIAAAIAAAKLSPVAVMEQTLARIATHDTQLQAYVHLNECALREARAAATATTANAGRTLGPLHGVPIAVKDNYLTEGMPTTAGTHAPGYAYPQKDSAAVARLRAAGAIVIGKTRTHEFAWGTETPPTKNPWDPSRIPGGSSGGSGAAVAARMAYAALGSDTGGSIRIPASLCGVVGLKPTFGRVSRSGIVPHSWSLDHAGPLTRTVRDAALLLQVLAGFDPEDSGSSNVPVPNYLTALEQNIAGLRIGVCRNHFFGRNEAEVEARVECAISDLAALGATIVDFEVPNLRYGLGAIFAIELASSAAFHDRGIQAGATRVMADDVRRLIDIGRLVSGADYLLAEQYRAVLIADFEAVFRKVDVVVTPTSPVTAWGCEQRSVVTGGVEESPLSASWRLTYPFNLTGLPALSVPCGFDSRGLPVGLQIAGRPFDEAMVLRVGHAYEALHQWHTRWPPFAIPPL